MELISVDREMCRRDGICVQACPLGSIATDAEGYPVPAEDAACIRCGQCVAICPHGALENALVPMADFTPAPRERAGFPALLGLMKARRSVRDFKDQAVPRETLMELLDAARIAPTARNSQQVGYLVLADPARTRLLADGASQWLMDQPGMERYVRLRQAGRDVVLRGAPHAVVAYADADSGWGEVDASIALTYLELAAAAHGLGACWAGLLHRALQHSPGLAASIGLPEGKAVCGALMLGVPRQRYALVPPRNAAQVVWV